MPPSRKNPPAASSSPTRRRWSASPESLVIGSVSLDFSSPQARTFFILGSTVVWGYQPHLQIIGGLRSMKNAGDLATAREYGIRFSGKLTQDELETFRSRLGGVLGENRRRNKAGRIWLNAPTTDGEPVTVVSFWARSASIQEADVHLLRKAFGVESGVWVDWIDRKRARFFAP